MYVGLNVGFSAVKCYAGPDKTSVFPSVVGSPPNSHFSMGDSDAGIILTKPAHRAVGNAAIEQSRLISRRRNLDWIESGEWLLLAQAALSEVTDGTAVTLQIATGLPLSDQYERLAALVRDRLLATHQIQRQGRRAQTLTVERAAVVPESFGTLFDLFWSDALKVVRPEVMGTVGVFDFGGGTTNLLVAKSMRDVGYQSALIESGVWDVVETARAWVNSTYPKARLRDHQVVAAITAGHFQIEGAKVPMPDRVRDALKELAAQAVATADAYWPVAQLDQIVLTGGGALLVAPYVHEYKDYRRAVVVTDPVLANARGFWKYARFLDAQH